MSRVHEANQEILSYLTRIAQAVENLDKKVSRVAEYLWVIGEENWDNSQIERTVFAGVHGNEWGGVAALAEWIESTEFFPNTLAIGIGNPAGVKARRRFLESDLNRSFGHPNPCTYEQKRAVELEQVLANSQYFLDLHQTIQPSQNAFWIFPWDEESASCAVAIDSKIPIVTHKGGGFSKDGKCSDEFVQSKGGVGFTVELGEQGLHDAQIQHGVELIRQFLQPLERHQKPEYVLDTIESISSKDEAQLNPGLENFQSVQSGDVIGSTLNGPLISQRSGYLLFPKYIKPGEPRPAEICRVVNKASWLG